ncbi:MAG: electron transfer flavoprotein subunit alpha/FixB family protein [Anaerolineae bacterium]|jgi:electron transfer flavoprotein alpha subunit
MEDFEYLQALMGGEELPEISTEYRDIWVLTDGTPEGLIVVDQARRLAEALGARVQAVLVPGEHPLGEGDETSELIAAGADRVHVAAEGFARDAVLAEGSEVTVNALAPFLEEAKPEFILCADSWLGRGVAPRLAQRLGAGLATRCLEISINESDRTLIAMRPVYEGEYYEVVNFAPHWPQMATLITASLSQPYLDRYRSGETDTLPLDLSATARVRVLGEATPRDGPVPLEKASVVVSGGAALGEAGFEKLAALAERLGGAFAGAREAFELSWIEKERLVDITGHKIAPRLYMAFGVAGDVMHAAGVKGAKFIVAVHPDPEAPIFAQADLGIVGNPAEVIEQLLATL